MRKNLFPVFVILLLTACENESISPAISETHQTIERRSEGNEVSICHSGNNLHININAVPAHQAHGDAVDMDDDGYFNLPNDCSTGVDCNDNDPAIHPIATEACDDNIDNNCNGEIDEDCFPTVTICDQVWMLKNLNVDHYRNGDPIPKVTDDATWNALTTGAYCYYNNDSVSYAATYGKIYNGYAVRDPRGLAPAGWHIPDNYEWINLRNCVGGGFTAGGPLKEAGTAHFISPNEGATNLSGFTGLPGGGRFEYGFFVGIREAGVWWSSSIYETNPDLILGWVVDTYSEGLGILGFSTQAGGASVRCLKD